MAIYEFLCDECGTEYDYLDPNSDPTKKRPCPKCRKMNKKVMSAPAFHLKDEGCGWASKGYSRRRSVADGPEGDKANRFKKSGKTVVPVRSQYKLEPNKDTTNKKKPKLCVKK
jgi:putative FmdB family regulatory protein